MSRLRGLSCLVFAAAMMLGVSRAHATVIVDCEFGNFTHFITRGFYVASFPGDTLGTVTMFHSAAVAGERTIALSARLTSYDGTLIGVAQATRMIETSPTKTVFDFGNIPVTAGSRITFSQALIAGNAANLYYDGGNDACAGVTTTADTAPPLSVTHRDSAGVIITGDPESITNAINFHCPYGPNTDPGLPYVRGFYIVNYRGTTIDTVRLRHKAGVAGDRTLNLIARLSRFDDGPLVGVASVTRNITTAFTETVYDFGNAPVPAGSVLTFEHVLAGGTPGVTYDPGFGPCEYVAVTNATTSPLDTLVGDRVGVKIRGRIATGAGITAVEYLHSGFGHYFVTADADEIAGLDGGAYGGVFSRTGQVFYVRNGPVPGYADVCRFFTTPGTFGTKSSHFYTADVPECEGLKVNPNWIYEKIAYFTKLPTGGTCPSGFQPVYRMYNDGMTGAPNHRFVRSLAIYTDFTTNQGWTGEGVRFCSYEPLI